MKLLLDTHMFIWWNGNLNRMPLKARALCADRNNTLVLSLASIWEMQIKSQLGKLILNQSLPMMIENQQQANGLELLPITTAHIYALQQLPLHHNDPFDRLLIAQAHIEPITLISADAVFEKYNIQSLL